VIKTEYIKEILEDILKQKDMLLVDLAVTGSGRIMIYIDRQDRGVTLDECAEISKAVEGKLNRDEEDFELEVSSPGTERSLVLLQQYGKHKGREVYIATSDGESYTGKLLAVNGDVVVIGHEKNMKDAKTGKKVPVVTKIEISFGDIKKAKIIFSK
jgi:ribosome maturation factor RimP